MSSQWKALLNGFPWYETWTYNYLRVPLFIDFLHTLQNIKDFWISPLERTANIGIIIIKVELVCKFWDSGYIQTPHNDWIVDKLWKEDC